MKKRITSIPDQNPGMNRLSTRRGLHNAARAVSSFVWVILTVGLANAGAAASGPPHGPLPETVVAPDQWSIRLLDRCMAQRMRSEAALAELEGSAAASALSVEDLAFPNQERVAEVKRLDAERRDYFARLSFFLMGDKARSLPAPSKGYRQAAQLPGPKGPDPLQRSLELVFGDATACQMEAFQATLLFAYFNVPFTEERLRATLAEEDVLHEVERVFRRYSEEGSADETFLKFDRKAAEAAQAYVKALLFRLARIASRQVAVNRAEILPSQPQAQQALNDDLRKVLAVPEDVAISGRAEKGKDELGSLLSEIEAYIQRAAEPARIRAFTHVKIEEFEGALRTSVPDKQFDRLETEVEEALFPDGAAMIALQKQAPAQILLRVNAIVDRWFRSQAMPALEKALFHDPFSSYWFFVQTGGLPRAGRPYQGSDLSFSSSVGFSLDRLRGQSSDQILDQLRSRRVPENFIVEHERLEQEIQQVVLSRQQALGILTHAPLSDKDRRRLEAYIRDPRESDTISTTDVYRWLIADSNKVAGHVDRGLAGAAIKLLHLAKRQRLDAYLEHIRQTWGGPDRTALVGYLKNAGEMMLELERRQAVDGRFQQSTGAGIFGWLLGGFLLGNTVPVQLWIPGGVNGPEFAELMNELTPKNSKSHNTYRAKEATRISLVHDGGEYHETAIQIIDKADNFINIAGFDWKRDKGGKELAYRIMAKKLGIAGGRFEALVHRFRDGLPLVPGGDSTRLYDVPSTSIKNLLVYEFFLTSECPEIRSVREQLLQLPGGFNCATVRTCGDLAAAREVSGSRHRKDRSSQPSYQSAWDLFRKLQTLFEGSDPGLDGIRPRLSLAEYLQDPADVRRFVQKFGLHRPDSPAIPLPVHILIDGKQSLIFNSTWGFTKDPPFLRHTPVNELYAPLMEFGAKVVLWKGILEFPWHVGPIPLPGRKAFGFLPMPFVPYPWLFAVPGFGWAGTAWSLFLQFTGATDPRNWWATVTHTKHFSNEKMGLESGLGIGSKYINAYSDFKTWHDMGVVVEGPVVDDLNDYFVQIFNEARVNNSGNAGSKGVSIPRLDYDSYRAAEKPDPGTPMRNPSWVVTTHPEHGDFNYRAVLLTAIAAARDNIYIESSFFSDPVVPQMLIRKAKEFRGRVSCQGLDPSTCSERKREKVQIHVILPGASDKPVLDAVASTEFHEMLHLGIKIYRWNPPEGWSSTKMLHTKSWLIDYKPGQRGLTYVGSSNATHRSHILDNEAGIVSSSPSFAQEVYTHLFAPDMKRDSRVESAENFHIAFKTRWAIRSGRWLRRFLLSFFFI